MVRWLRPHAPECRRLGFDPVQELDPTRHNSRSTGKQVHQTNTPSVGVLLCVRAGDRSGRLGRSHRGRPGAAQGRARCSAALHTRFSSIS